MAGSTTLVQTVLLLLLVLTVALLTEAQDNRQCLDNPNGTLSVDVRGVPGPEGPRGELGPKGNTGEAGNRGYQGKTKERGIKGDIGPMGIKGMTGQTGAKGQKGRIGIQGPLGPTGAPGLPGPQGTQGDPGEGLKGERGRDGIEGTTGQTGGRGQKGTRGIQGPLGPTGAPGFPGPQGTQGEPGDTVLNEEELDRVREMVDEAVNASIIERIASVEVKLSAKIEALHSNSKTLCNITSADWTRVAYLDTTQGQACPPALRTFTNTTTNQTACGTQHTTQVGAPVVSMRFPTNRRYTHVCGRVRGYVYYHGLAFDHHKRFGQNTIDSIYADGVSITMGNSRQHLWTYVVGLSETHNHLQYACPCARSNYDSSHIQSFIGNNYYCESAFVGTYDQRIAWEDPLWDGKNCVTTGNTCCQRSGWFHREVPPTEDYIEVRWMKYWDSSQSDVLTDQLEIWVM